MFEVSPSLTRRSWKIALVIVIAVFGVTWYYWVRYNSPYYYHHPNPGATTFHVQPTIVEPGHSFTLSATFTRVFDYGFSTANSHISILDASGNDMMVGRSRAYAPSNTNSKNQDLDPTASGFIFGETPKPIVQPATGPTLFSIEEIGCALGLGPPIGPPPSHYTDEEMLYVLPATPSGVYTIVISPGAYCNGQPSEVHRLTLTVS